MFPETKCTGTVYVACEKIQVGKAMTALFNNYIIITCTNFAQSTISDVLLLSIIIIIIIIIIIVVVFNKRAQLATAVFSGTLMSVISVNHSG